MWKYCVGVVGCILLLSLQAVAGEEAAKKLFAQGMTLFANKQYSEAATKFREAYDAAPTWKLLYNIGHSEAAAKRYGLALEAFEGYLAEGGDEITLERQDSVRDEIERLSPLVGALEVTTHDGALIFVDGIKRGTAPVYGGIPIAAAKKHEVKVDADDVELEPIFVRVMGGKTVKVTLLQNETPATDQPTVELTDQNVELTDQNVELTDQNVELTDQNDENTAAPHDKAKQLKSIGWVMLGIGVAGIGTGAITGGLALGKEKELDEKCVGSQCEPSDKGISDTRDTLATVSTVAFGVGAAATVAGIVMAIIGTKKSKEKLSYRVMPTASGIAVTF